MQHGLIPSQASSHENLRPSIRDKRAVFVQAADIDEDGIIDVVIGGVDPGDQGHPGSSPVTAESFRPEAGLRGRPMQLATRA